jgi:hypothetical protein
MEYDILTLFYTDECNFECRHCMTSSGPGRKGKMEPEDTVGLIRDASASGIKEVVLTGGEPLLYMEEVCMLGRASKSLGMGFSVVTNCFWSDTEENSLRMLRRLRESGLTSIRPSYDRFHAEFIPIENIIYCKKAADELGVHMRVGVCFHGEGDEEAQEIHRVLTGNNIEVRVMYVSPMGRGASLERRGWSFNIHKLPCIASRSIGITRKRFYACCGGVSIIDDDNPLSLGDRENTSFTSMMGKARDLEFVEIIRAFGPQGLYDVVEDESIRDPGGLFYCELCSRILNSRRNFLKLEEAFNTGDGELLTTLSCARLYNSYLHKKKGL